MRKYLCKNCTDRNLCGDRAWEKGAYGTKECFNKNGEK
jgi:hypothetical protein